MQLAEDKLEQALAEFSVQLRDPARQWFMQALQGVNCGEKGLQNTALYSAMARRKLGEEVYPGFPLPGHWTVAHVGRVFLLYRILLHYNNESRALVFTRLYREGDEQEKIAWLKAMSLMDTQGLMVEHMVHAARTNSQEAYAAIALYNPYPARHYCQEAFNQLVLKALFMDLDIRQVQGILQRMNPTMKRLVTDLKEERRAAGRVFPQGIDWLLSQ
ncbi:EboA domain-containing protein [Bowmanella dokdonensis]|uniref:EboA domain-containing protein n=1 Tax=Bowmanella dokdonensis TaxID=751969 RepID=A0A939DJE2_9ALTE|nr:EboA domain-containing protein [Bowmanella dokdonensis]MBN7823819.1 EboA domain-containing protein [Bowmanella dokdonensis]